MQEILKLEKKINEYIESNVTDEYEFTHTFALGKILADSTKLFREEISKDIPYGRYLVFKNTNCNLQIDVFSKNYIGRIHNHETWGILSIIKGTLKVNDYFIVKDELNLIRSSLLQRGSFSSFLQHSDLHSTETFSNEQAVSFHLYGKEFDIDNGLYYSSNNKKIQYKRGELKNFSEISQLLML
tara:strand:+ start:394 stop:945 length:552 start_codon:yes stop_codon:yes gene_type:complete